MDNSTLVADARIKKCISEHRKCPFFVVNIETGENVQEVFYAGDVCSYDFLIFNISSDFTMFLYD